MNSPPALQSPISDIAKFQSWLEAQGFTVDDVSRSKNRITFSGTVDQVERAFATELHYYSVDGKKEYAPAADISVPAALASLVQTVKNLSTFRPHPRVRFNTRQRTTSANFTSAQTGHHFLTPNDIATIYDINPVYHAGYTGTGQSIAVVGQSEIVVSDIEHFQTAAGFSIKDPQLVLVPGSGSAAISPNNEAESDLDLEYSSTIAQGATIYFVYVGDNPQYSVWDSIQYAVENKVAPIISDSYGVCETALSATDYSTLTDVLAQAASQGQTVIVPAGDNGSTDCYGENGLTADQWQALAVDFPGSSQYVTGLGGTEFPAADVATSNTTYWQSANGNDVISSALSYIPEQVWNDDSARDGIASGGGGVSTLTARPSWQTGVPGIPSGNYRLVPDLSLTASADDASYLYCTSDTTAWSSGQQASCNSGFRDSATGALTAAGGTSFAVPIFAGLVAIINDKLNSTGQGMINPTLYSLAASSTNYASAFHDRNSSFSEKPVRSRPRRLVDWINPTGAKKVHSLIDKVYGRKNLEMAWEKVKENRGSGGVDGQSLGAFSAYLGVQLARLERELKEDAYRPQPVLQHPITKRDKPGEYRMLGVPTIYDRVCQQALLNRLEPIFEPVFDDASFGYRRGRSTKDALRKIWKEIQSGSEWIVDGDLRDFFFRVCGSRKASHASSPTSSRRPSASPHSGDAQGRKLRQRAALSDRARNSTRWGGFTRPQ